MALPAAAPAFAGKLGLGLRPADLWANRELLLKLLAGVFGALLALLLLVLIIVTVVIDVLPIPSLKVEVPGRSVNIPPVYAPMYASAAKQYRVNAYALAALHSTESTYSTNDAAFTPNSAGALGPMQFLPSTWAGYQDAYRAIAAERPKSYPRQCAHHGCITDDFDAIAGAAAMLHALGAGPELDGKTLRAFTYYKGTPPWSIAPATKAFDIAVALQAGGDAAAPLPGAPAGGLGGAVPVPSGPLLSRVVKMANWIDAQHFHYCWGGGHTSPARPSHGADWCRDDSMVKVAGSRYIGLDCSGTVSMVLQHVGYTLPTMTAVLFKTYGEAGEGKHVTIWANKVHVFLEIDHRFFGTSDGNFAGGPRWGRTSWSTIGYTPRHPPGL